MEIIYIDLRGTTVTIDTRKSKDKNYFKRLFCRICDFYANTETLIDDVSLKKNILKQILAFNCFFEISYEEVEGLNDVSIMIIDFVARIMCEYKLYIICHNFDLRNYNAKCVISMKKKECSIKELDLILPNDFDNEIA